ncbi:hypothetical protein HQ560_05005 [bacterium]|nr:hypothetical protein [bacterium]
MPSTHQPPTTQSASERAARGGDVASQALNEALRTSFRLLKFAMLLVIVLFLTSGIFTVSEKEQVFKLHFGQLVTHTDKDGNKIAVLEPGIHFAWPFLIDEVVRYPIKRNITVDIGDFWYVMGPDAPPITPAMALDPERGGYNITGDANILHSGWSVTYSIDDPVALCKNLTDPTELAAPASEARLGEIPKLIAALMRNAVIRTMASFAVDDAYGGKRDLLSQTVAAYLEKAIADLDADGHGIGIVINHVTLVTIEPPPQVRRDFASVTKASQARERLVSDARGYARSVLTRAKSDGQTEINMAKEYANRIVNEAQADAKYLSTLLEQYPNAPEKLSLLLEQRRLEVIQSVLAEADETFVTSLGKGKGSREVRVWVNRDPETRRENIRRKRLLKNQSNTIEGF